MVSFEWKSRLESFYSHSDTMCWKYEAHMTIVPCGLCFAWCITSYGTISRTCEAHMTVWAHFGYITPCGIICRTHTGILLYIQQMTLLIGLGHCLSCNTESSILQQMLNTLSEFFAQLKNAFHSIPALYKSSKKKYRLRWHCCSHCRKSTAPSQG